MTKPFPYMPDELIVWLERELDVIADTVTGELEARMEAAGKMLVRVRQAPSPADDVTQYARVQLEVFGFDRDAVIAKAKEIHAGLSPRTRLDAATIDTVRTDALPHEIPWGNAKVRRCLATYQISTR